MGRLFHDQNPEAIKEKFDKFNLHGFPWFSKLKVSHRNHYMLNQKRINKLTKIFAMQMILNQPYPTRSKKNQCAFFLLLLLAYWFIYLSILTGVHSCSICIYLFVCSLRFCDLLLFLRLYVPCHFTKTLWTLFTYLPRN